MWKYYIRQKGAEVYWKGNPVNRPISFAGSTKTAMSFDSEEEARKEMTQQALHDDWLVTEQEVSDE